MNISILAILFLTLYSSIILITFFSHLTKKYNLKYSNFLDCFINIIIFPFTSLYIWSLIFNLLGQNLEYLNTFLF